MKALVFQDKVIQIEETTFPVARDLVWMDAPIECKAGWILANGSLKAKPEPEKTPKQIQQPYLDAIKFYLDKIANEKDYDNEQSISSYMMSTNEKWKSESQAFIEWRDKVWLYAYDILNKIERGEIELPETDQFISGLPAIVWPS